MNGVQSRVTVIWKILLLCVVCAICNAVVNYLLIGLLKVPLFLDTVFTVAMCFTAGLLPGILTGILSPLVAYLIYYLHTGLPLKASWFYFTICILVEILLVCFFHAKMKPREEIFLRKPSLGSFTGLAVHLLVLVALDCIVISIAGGTMDFILYKLSVSLPPSFEDTFELSLLRNNVPVPAAAILARIPINIVDRFIAIFGGYGISLVLRKAVR